MEEFDNVAEDLGSEEIVTSEPLSIRDSLKSAMDGDTVADTRARDEAGRFAQRQQEVVAPVVKPELAAVETPVVEQLVAPQFKPPSSWDPVAKTAFASADPTIQAAIAKREEEVNNGFKVLSDYKGLEEFTPIIRQAGTSHAEVMRKAIDWERSLASDPVNTVLYVAQMAGVDLAALVNGQQQPQRAPQPQPQVRPEMIDHRVNEILQQREVKSSIEAFLSDPANEHAEAVMDTMIALIKTGQSPDLKSAYETACWANPTTREGLIKQAAPAPVIQTPRPNPADQARKAAKSISGSSSPGPSQGAEMNSQSSSVREALQHAIASAGTRA